MKKDVKSSSLISDIWHVVKKEKKYWIVPLLVLLFGVIGLILLAGSAGPLAPFIYCFISRWRSIACFGISKRFRG